MSQGYFVPGDVEQLNLTYAIMNVFNIDMCV